MELLVDVTDEDLLRAGDAAGLVRRYYGPVYGLARRLLGNGADARDAAQETFVRAIAHLADFDRRASFRTWLFAIAANHVRDLLRRKKQLPLDPATEESLPALTLPETPLFRREDRDRILAAVDRLPFDLKIVVTLQFQQDLAYREIAETLGISVNAVRIRLFRALSLLRKELS
ncbi:MAG TPA: sigma-70 family RNA polymerase sigma factor [Planctomycetota bacterium]|nr:sigma-70 family RNA polymerase sigma factor [Planctomycetota bacterium]